MPPESDDNLRLEIGHVRFIDIVGYSELLNKEQKAKTEPDPLRRDSRFEKIVGSRAPKESAAAK